MTQPMNTLPKGARFIGLDGRTTYQVTVPACDDPSGYVEVINLSRSDSREGLFSTGQVERDVEVLR